MVLHKFRVGKIDFFQFPMALFYECEAVLDWHMTQCSQPCHVWGHGHWRSKSFGHIMLGDSYEVTQERREEPVWKQFRNMRMCMTYMWSNTLSEGLWFKTSGSKCLLYITSAVLKNTFKYYVSSYRCPYDIKRSSYHDFNHYVFFRIDPQVQTGSQVREQ